MATSIPFVKMHGLGNDFIIVDCRTGLPNPDKETIIALSNRRTGIGCDQFIVLENSYNGNDVFMRMYNCDGAEVGACGNATRCVARLIMVETQIPSCTIETISGILGATWADQNKKTITIDMGLAKLDAVDIPLSLSDPDTVTTRIDVGIDGLPLACCVNMGNPHAVFQVDNADDFDVEKYGSMVENSPLFPEKTNVEFISLLKNGDIRMRVWERGVGITQACGTGACAAAVAAVRTGLIDITPVDIILDGGVLTINWHVGQSVFMTGATSVSFTGLYDPDTNNTGGTSV